MILLDFIEGTADDDAPERRLKIRLDWIGRLREHEVQGTLIDMHGFSDSVWVKPTIDEVAAEMFAEDQKYKHAMAAQQWHQNGAMRR